MSTFSNAFLVAFALNFTTTEWMATFFYKFKSVLTRLLSTELRVSSFFDHFLV